MKKIYIVDKLFTLCFLILYFLFIASSANSQVALTATGGALTGAYTTVKEAFDSINSGYHTGSINIEITANTIEGTTPANLNSSGAGAASYTSVVIRPASDTVSISGNPPAGFGVIQLIGADNVWIDGDNPNTAGTYRNLTINNTNLTTATYNSVIRIVTAAFATTADDNFISNCIINGNVINGNASGLTGGSSSLSFGIYCGGNSSTTTLLPLTSLTTYAQAGTTINGLNIQNNVINQCARAITFNGINATVANNLTITQNIIGSAGIQTGAPPYTSPSNTVYVTGILVRGTSIVSITNNTIQNIISYVAADMSGIELVAGIGSLAAISGNTIYTVSQNRNLTSDDTRGILLSASVPICKVSSNSISNIRMVGSGTCNGIQSNVRCVIEKNFIDSIINDNGNSYGANGINITGAGSGGTNDSIKNNSIINVHNRCGGTGVPNTRGAFGIRISGGSGHYIYHNSIHQFGAQNTNSGTGINLVTSLGIIADVYTGLNIRNNIFSNRMTGGNSITRFVNVHLPSGGTSSMNLTLNNNAYYGGKQSNSKLAHVGTSISGGTSYATTDFNPNSTSPSNNFRSYTSTLSGSSLNDNESFADTAALPSVSNSDLHIPECTETKLETGGANLGVYTDIDDDVRPGPLGSTCGIAAAPDIGFDEFDGKVTYNLILGNVSADIRVNGSVSFPIQNVILSLNNGERYTFSGDNGNYYFKCGSGDQTVSIPNPPIYLAPNPSTNTANFTSGSGNISSSNNFNMIQNTPGKDLEVLDLSSGALRPGFPVTYTVVYRNNTLEPADGDVVFSFPSQYFEPPASGLEVEPFEDLALDDGTQTFTIDLDLKSSVSNGTEICSDASISYSGDIDPSNNQETHCRIVTGGFDPNDKTVYPAGFITPAQVADEDILKYRIRFQNTGTDTTFTVRVLDTISPKLNLLTFEMIYSSHAYTMALSPDGIMEWTFNNILLPDSTTNEPESHGYILYRIKPKNNLVIGDTIKNTAHIYFDYNLPVATNTTQTPVADPDREMYLTMRLQAMFPVPDTVTVLLRSSSSPYSLLDSGNTVLSPDTTFYSALVPFTNISGGDAYVVVKHRNSIETWSANPVTISGDTTVYNFTASLSQAFGNNMISINGIASFYSGDVNQDGSVDLEDMLDVYNDGAAFITGYAVTDLNGDNTTDLSDLLITYNNSVAFVAKKIPN